MDAMIVSREIAWRLGFFCAVFFLMAAWELIASRRVLTTSKASRWLSNLTMTLFNLLFVRLVTPIIPLGLAVLAEERNWGLLNNIELPYGVAVLASVVLLDLSIYLQHVMFHAVPLLWRLHMVHHADLDFDVTTGLRFHPVEMCLSLGIKLSVVTVLGPPALAVLIFEILLNATAMFNHSNVGLPQSVDRLLRWLVVTPDMHRVHHSVIRNESNSNFGFNLPWWDRILGTYRAQPLGGHKGMRIGLHQFRDPARLTLPWMLALPFIAKPGEYPINRSEGDSES
jgi:sterol desaturase/sphingolipid hydroxylase (fatty acid hydroxylase superfamily)